MVVLIFSAEIKVEKEKTAWKGCVICQVNMTQLEVHMSMGNVMGKTLFVCNDFGCNTKYDTYPNKDKVRAAFCFMLCFSSSEVLRSPLQYK